MIDLLLACAMCFCAMFLIMILAEQPFKNDFNKRTYIKKKRNEITP
jgi:hypothetical protein